MTDLTEDERELLQLLKEYGEAVADARIWPMSGDQCRIDGRNSVILAHYRTAKKEEWASGYQSCREDHGITEEDDQP